MMDRLKDTLSFYPPWAQIAADLGIAFMENSRLTQILLNEAQDGVEGVKVVQSFNDEETGQPLNYSPKIKTNALIVADQFLSQDVFLYGHLISVSHLFN